MAARTLRTLLLGACLAFACPNPIPAHAESPPSDQLTRLDERLKRARIVRITTLSSTTVVDSVRVGVEGIAYRNILSTTRGEPLTVLRPIPWDGVVRVDVRGNAALRTAVVSGLAVLVITAAAVALTAQQGGDAGPGGGVIVYAIPPVVVLGAAVGALIPAWHPIYRKRHDSAGRR